MVRRVVAYQCLGVLCLHRPVHGVLHNPVQCLDVRERLQKPGDFRVKVQINPGSGLDGRHGARLRGVAPIGLVRNDLKNSGPMSREIRRAHPGTSIRPRYKSMNLEQCRNIWDAFMAPQVGLLSSCSEDNASRSPAKEGVSEETGGRVMNENFPLKNLQGAILDSTRARPS